jgi:hypothetical protein
VLLGLLGHEQREHLPSATCPVPIDPILNVYSRETYALPMYLIGCPLAPAHDVALADQQFERGVMIWAGQGLGRIYAIRSDPLPVTWTSYIDGWQEGQPESGGLTPPAGLREPIRGFGKVWREQPGVRQALGWATSPERGDSGIVQSFTGGGAIVYMQGSNFLYLFGPNGMTWAF